MSNVDDTVDRFIAAWNRMDVDQLQNCWHAEASNIYYVAEEVEQAFHSFDKVVAYWNITCRLLSQISMTLSDRHSNYLTDELCVVTYNIHVLAQLRNSRNQETPDVDVKVRVSAILRKTDCGWRFIHYVEAPTRHSGTTSIA